MSIRYVCEHCGASMKIKDELAGKKGHCPKCKGEFAIPASPPSADVDEYSLALPGDIAGTHDAEVKNAPRDVTALPDFPASEDSEHAAPPSRGGKTKREPVFDPDDPFAGLGDDEESPRPAPRRAPAAAKQADPFEEEPSLKLPSAAKKPARQEPAEEEEEWEDFHDQDESPPASGKRELPRAKGSAASIADDFMRSFAGSGADDLGEAESPKKKRRRIFGGGGEDKGLSEGNFELADLFMFGLTRALPILAGTILLIWGVYAVSSRMMGGNFVLPPLGQVTGTVKLDGAALPGATVMFRPIGDSGESLKISGSIAITDNAGVYHLVYMTDVPGAAVGKHRVEIRARNAQSQELIPRNYNVLSTLFVEVKSGNNTHDFPLETGKKP